MAPMRNFAFSLSRRRPSAEADVPFVANYPSILFALAILFRRSRIKRLKGALLISIPNWRLPPITHLSRTLYTSPACQRPASRGFDHSAVSQFFKRPSYLTLEPGQYLNTRADPIDPPCAPVPQVRRCGPA